MPEVVAIGIAAVAGGAGAAAAGTPILVGALIGAAGTGLQLLAASAFAPEANALQPSTQVEPISGTDEPARFIFGEARVWGVAIWQDTISRPETTDVFADLYQFGQAETNEWLVGVVVVACEPITSYQSWSVDEEELTFNGEDITAAGGGNPADPQWQVVAQDPFDRGSLSAGQSRLMVSEHLGSASPSVDPLLNFDHTDPSEDGSLWYTGIPSEWDSTKLGTNQAYFAFAAFNDFRSFAGRKPRLNAVVRGHAVYDPRESSHSVSDPATWAWTDNPALIAAHVARHTWTDAAGHVFALTYGYGADQIDWDLVTAAANVCDEMVEAPVGADATSGMHKRYRYGAEISLAAEPQAILDAVIAAMAGERTRTDGKLRLYAGAWAAPVEHITDDWLCQGPIDYRAKAASRDLINTLLGTHVNKERLYLSTSYPQVSLSDAIAQDGGRVLAETLDLPGVQDHGQAQRIALIRLRQARLQRQIAFNLPLGRALRIRPGDRVTVTLPDYGLDGVTFRVRSWALDDARDLIYRVQLREDAASAYAFTLSELSELPSEEAA